MLLRIALLFMLVCSAPLPAADGVWKWVDAQGVTHYSDRPVPGAVQVDIKVQAPTQSGPTPTTGATPATNNTPAPPAAPVYRTLEIWRPTRDEAIINTGGVVPVRMRVDPQLRPRHTLNVYLDGKLAQTLSAGAFDTELQNVPRGAHSVVAVVTDDAGTIVQQGQPVIFHVRQESVAQPPVGPALRPPRAQ